MNKKLCGIFVKTFEYIYSKVFSYNDYAFIPSDNQKKQINNFIVYLDKKVGISSIGEEWVFNYLVFSFKQRVEQKTRYKNKIPLNWVIGKKAFELYEKRSGSWLYFNGLFCQKYGILFEQEIILIGAKGYYNDLRQQYYRDKYPLHLCLGFVNFNSKSKYCLVCKDGKICKEINNGV